MKGKVTLALFTHPVCSGCSEAYGRVQAFARDREDVEVEFYSLAGSSGRELARRWKVDSVPTVIVGGDPDHRIEGVRSVRPSRPPWLHSLGVSGLPRPPTAQVTDVQRTLTEDRAKLYVRSPRLAR